MHINKEKLAYAISAIWGLISLPLSEFVYDEALDSGLQMRIFALLVVLAPVWIVFGWRWLTDNRSMSPKFWLGVVGAAILLDLVLVNDYSLDDVAGVPTFCLIPFLLLVWNFERGNMLWWRKPSLDQVLPSPNDFKGGVGTLVKLTEDLSNEILEELRRLAPDLKLPIPIPLHAPASLLCAYGLVYFNLREHGFQKGSKVIAVFSGYKSMMITSYLSKATPKIPGVVGLFDAGKNEPEIREPAKELLEMKEEVADTVRDNLARNAANPFYPLYDGLRPYVGGAGATSSDLNAAFDSTFAKWNGTAKWGVESFLRQMA